MPKYLWQVNFNTTGVQGLLKEGGTGRHEYVRGLVDSLGGTLEAFYFMWGEDDLLLIAELPDDATAAAVALNVAASGALSIRTTPLLDPDVIDAAGKKQVSYRPPGA
jgi:uncharacterized protein with GYD domain